MRTLKSLLVLFLCLTISLQAVAGMVMTRPSHEPAPAAEPQAVEAMHAGCLEADTSVQAADDCDLGDSCQSCSHCPVFFYSALPSLPLQTAVIPLIEHTTVSLDFTAVWRPPTQHPSAH